MNKIVDLFFLFFQVCMLFIISWYMPFSYMLPNSSISIMLDLFYLYLIIQSLIRNQIEMVCLGFLMGFLFDLDNELTFIGLNSLLMPISCYCLSFLRLNSSNWNFYVKIIYILAILIISYSIKSIFYQWSLIPHVVPIIINSLLVIVTFLSINKYYYKNQLMK